MNIKNKTICIKVTKTTYKLYLYLQNNYIFFIKYYILYTVHIYYKNSTVGNNIVVGIDDRVLLLQLIIN